MSAETKDFSRYSLKRNAEVVQRIYELNKMGVKLKDISKQTATPASTVKLILLRIERGIFVSREAKSTEVSGMPATEETATQLFQFANDAGSTGIGGANVNLHPDRMVIQIANAFVGAGYSPESETNLSTLERISAYITQAANAGVDLGAASVDVVFNGNLIHPSTDPVVARRFCAALKNVLNSERDRLASRQVNFGVKMLIASLPRMRGTISSLPQKENVNPNDALALKILSPEDHISVCNAAIYKKQGLVIIPANWLKRSPGRNGPDDFKLHEAIQTLAFNLGTDVKLCMFGCGGVSRATGLYTVSGDFGRSLKMTTFQPRNAFQHSVFLSPDRPPVVLNFNV